MLTLREFPIHFYYKLLRHVECAAKLQQKNIKKNATRKRVFVQKKLAKIRKSTCRKCLEKYFRNLHWD